MKKIATVAAAACTASALWSMPAYPGLVRTTQPDGSAIEIVQRGDENFHWAETADGRLMMRDSEGFWREANPAAVETRARQTKASTPPLTQIDGTFPATGKRRLLMLLLNYSDTRPVYSQAHFDSYMNSEGFNGVGSFRDFYLQNSYGALDITTTVTRWVTLSRPKSAYGADGAVTMIAEALSMLEGEIDLTQFDNDGDGILDGLAVIHQGAGQEASGDASDIWSHSATIYNMEFGGVQVRRYTIQPEILASTGGMSTIGVMCHEFGHNLGAPDFYDTDYSLSGGEYCGTGV
ncbi:MAG: M6 family metalloprotease domain-containing protein, partial [Muribaculaceae bacterium]|nr:M6 family metalloprotease domain-containing protein [Muribaculaceae bacterium]